MVRDSSLARMAKLEEENIALQAEILSLKRQLLNQRKSGGGGSRPSSPEMPSREVPEDNNQLQELEATVSLLKTQVELATAELKKFRKTEIFVQPFSDSSPKISSPKTVVHREIAHLPVSVANHPTSGWGNEDDLFGNESPGTRKSAASSVTSSKPKPAYSDDSPKRIEKPAPVIAKPLIPSPAAVQRPKKKDGFDLDDLLN